MTKGSSRVDETRRARLSGTILASAQGGVKNTLPEIKILWLACEQAHLFGYRGQALGCGSPSKQVSEPARRLQYGLHYNFSAIK